MEDHYLSEFELDMVKVREHYLHRKDVSRNLRKLMEKGKEKEYVELAVGVTEAAGNYSAFEHQLGPIILTNNSVSSIFRLAQKLGSEEIKVNHVPRTIYRANLPYLKISVGSEMATMLQPNRIWVGNVRTIWSHLVIKHKGNWERANEELELYKIDDASSEMNYQIWRDIYLSLQQSFDVIQEIANLWAQEQGVTPGSIKYLWVDAVCSELFDAK